MRKVFVYILQQCYFPLNREKHLFQSSLMDKDTGKKQVGNIIIIPFLNARVMHKIR